MGRGSPARLAVLVAAVAVVAVGFRTGANAITTGTVACSTRSFIVVFDPKRSVSVRDSRSSLASASFTRASLSRTCKQTGEPKAFLDGGLGAEIRRKVTIQCIAPAPIRIHVNPITQDGSTVGSNLSVGVGTRLDVLVSAVLKNRGDPFASRVYLAPRHCRTA
jgi:hypothetical protein